MQYLEKGVEIGGVGELEGDGVGPAVLGELGNRC